MDGTGLLGNVVEQAEQRYEKMLEEARQAGDVGLEGAILQHLGALAGAREQHELAITRYKEALARFQETEDRAAVMQTADLLGSAEKDLGHYDAARSWYSEAARLARELGDEVQLAIVTQNVGILLKRQAVALPAAAAEERARLLNEAAASVATSLALEQKQGNAEGVGSSFFQLSVIRRLLGNLDEAERHAQQALAFYEPSDLPEVAKVYASLENIADARDRPTEAAAWRAKKEAKLAMTERLAPGAGPSDAGVPATGLPAEAREGFLALCQAIHAARSSGQPLAPELAGAIASLRAEPDPLGGVGRFLQSLADGALPDPPSGLPPELEEMFKNLLAALRALPSASSSPRPERDRSPRTVRVRDHRNPAPHSPPVDKLCPCGSGRPFVACHGAKG